MNSITLETDRLILRPFKLGDEEEVLAFASNPKVQEYTGDIVRTSIAEITELITSVWLHDYKTYGYGRFAVIYKEDNKIIGFNGVKYLPECDQTDLGYRFLPEYWGKGIATESSKAILEYAFNTLQLPEIIGFVEPENPASARVLEKLKFQKTASKPYPGETKDLDWFTLTKKKYERQ